MTSPKPLEEALLAPASAVLDQHCRLGESDSSERRFQILEAAASRVGGFSLRGYFEAFETTPVDSLDRIDQAGIQVVGALSKAPIHPSLALSALSREHLVKTTRRFSGAYHTDFRLALYIAGLGREKLADGGRVLDPACGAGILLVAAALVASGLDRKRTAAWLADNLYAADLSAVALRGARLSLASLTDDLDAIRSMSGHFRCSDSLLASESDWEGLSRTGFDLIVGNPPWEKLKLTRHEFLQSQGSDRHYGAEYDLLDPAAYLEEKNSVTRYSQSLINRYELIGSGEPDLYMAFVELFSKLIAPRGQVAVLVPAGLIRSYGTECLRKYLFKSVEDLSITVFDNRAKFFGIDTRFKFLAVAFSRPRNEERLSAGFIRLLHAKGTQKGVEQTGYAQISRRTLSRLRSDLSIPEVRTSREWRIFVAMANNGIDWSKPDSQWHPEFRREVDMTRDRKHFNPKSGFDSLPVIEGRMIQAHRFGAKSFRSGTGRRALWDPVPFGCSAISPQFWINKTSLSSRTLARSEVARAGFCDITGQTNERSMMAAMVPPNVVCGNKVPTLQFSQDPSEKRLYIWLAMVNSIPFDWKLRRLVTTTVNYFLLVNTQLPNIAVDSLTGQRMFELSKRLRDMHSGHGKYDHWHMAQLRAEADLLALRGYGLEYDDLVEILKDFPLLDRHQPTIRGEKRSTITRDYLLLSAARRFRRSTREVSERVAEAAENGAVPYVPAEYAKMNTNSAIGEELCEQYLD